MINKPFTINLDKGTVPGKIFYLIFTIIAATFFTIFMTVAIFTDVPIDINGESVAQGELKHTLTLLLLSAVFIPIIIYMIYKSIKFMTCINLIVIDSYNDKIEFLEKNIFSNRNKCKQSISISSTKELFLVLVTKKGTEDTTFEYNIYAINNAKQYDKITVAHDYKKALKIVEQISEQSGVPINDITDIDYSSEYDFVKFYKRRDE